MSAEPEKKEATEQPPVESKPTHPEPDASEVIAHLAEVGATTMPCSACGKIMGWEFMAVSPHYVELIRRGPNVDPNHNALRCYVAVCKNCSHVRFHARFGIDDAIQRKKTPAT